jgi:hypothetical protein
LIIRISNANNQLAQYLEEMARPGFKPTKVYGDALYKALLRFLRQWINKLIAPEL